MKTLQLNTHETGGAGIACLRLHEALLGQQIDSSVLVFNKGKSTLPNIHSYWERAYGGGLMNKFMHQMHVIERKLRWRKLNRLEKGYESFSFADNLLNIHKHPATQSVDVLNLHWVAWWLDYTSFFKTDKPIFWTLHDMTPFAYGVPYEIGFPFKAYQKLIAKNKAIIHKSLKNKEIHIITLNKWMHQKSSNSEAFGRFKHSIIPNSIDTSIFRPSNKIDIREELNIPQSAPVLLFVAGALDNKRKGLDLLFGALKHLRQEQLYVVAVGTPMKKTPEIGKHKLIQLGRIYNPNRLAQVYSMADLFIIPSREDNLPNTVVESIACGTPVVGYSIGGIPDMIQDNKNGLLCAEVNSAALAQTINQAFKTTFNRVDIRKDSVHRFSPEVQAKAYIELYKNA